MTDLSESRFWDKFIYKTKAYGIKPGVDRWFARHAEDYIKAHHGLRLARHTPQNVEAYLQDKGRNKRLEDWQFKQIVTAIRLLFTEMVHAPWAKTFNWDEWIAQARELPNGHFTLACDYQSIDGQPDQAALLQYDSPSGETLYLNNPDACPGKTSLKESAPAPPPAPYSVHRFRR